MSIYVHRKKLRLGLIYGMVAGLAFAVFAWGIDAWMLAQANAAYFWVKFIPGLAICVVAGGMVGWLTISIEKHGIAMLMWALLGVLYSWLAVWLPFTGVPKFIGFLNPDISRWFDFSPVQDLVQFSLISLLIIGIVSIIVGLLEINLIDQAILSAYTSGRVAALLVCIILFGLAGSATDYMINTILREPVQVVNDLLQFAQDNAGVEVPKATARTMHLSSARLLGDLIQKPRQLTLIGFDGNLGIIYILVDFAGTPAKCSTIFAQPTDCIILTSNP